MGAFHSLSDDAVLSSPPPVQLSLPKRPISLLIPPSFDVEEEEERKEEGNDISINVVDLKSDSNASSAASVKTIWNIKISDDGGNISSTSSVESILHSSGDFNNNKIAIRKDHDETSRGNEDYSRGESRKRRRRGDACLATYPSLEGPKKRYATSQQQHQPRGHGEQLNVKYGPALFPTPICEEEHLSFSGIVFHTKQWGSSKQERTDTGTRWETHNEVLSGELVHHQAHPDCWYSHSWGDVRTPSSSCDITMMPN